MKQVYDKLEWIVNDVFNELNYHVSTVYTYQEAHFCLTRLSGSFSYNHIF